LARNAPWPFCAARKCAWNFCRFNFYRRRHEQFAHRLAHFVRRRICRQRFAKTHRHRIQNTARPFPKEFPAFKTEKAARCAAERHGHNRRVHIFHDALKAALEFVQFTRPRDLSPGKDADDPAIADGIASPMQRANHFLRADFGRNRNDPRDADEGFDPRQIVIFPAHEKTHRPIRRHHQ
jgi:hypothetical protein